MAAAEYGVNMERGICRKIENGGAVVESLDRPGVISPPLKRLDGSLPAVGEKVWFWLAGDGDGMLNGGGGGGDIRAITDAEINEICVFDESYQKTTEPSTAYYSIRAITDAEINEICVFAA